MADRVFGFVVWWCVAALVAMGWVNAAMGDEYADKQNEAARRGVPLVVVVSMVGCKACVELKADLDRKWRGKRDRVWVTIDRDDPRVPIPANVYPTTTISRGPGRWAPGRVLLTAGAVRRAFGLPR